MKQAVWKFNLTIEDAQTVKMPAGAKLLSIQSQGTDIQLWALVDTEEKNVGHRLLLCIGTGQVAAEVPNLQPLFERGVELDQFVATVQDGPFVWHFFDAGWV